MEARNEQLTAQSVSQLAIISKLQAKTCALQAALVGAQTIIAREEARAREAEAAIRELQDAKAAAAALFLLAAAQKEEAVQRACLAEAKTSAALFQLAKASATQEVVSAGLKEVVVKSSPADCSLVGEKSGSSSPNKVPASPKNPARSLALQDSAISLGYPVDGVQEEEVVLAKKGGNNRARRQEKRMAKEKSRGDASIPKEVGLPIKKVPKIGPTETLKPSGEKPAARRVVDPITLIPKGYRIDYFEYDPKLPMEKYIVKL